MIKSRNVAVAIFFLALSLSWHNSMAELTKINVGYSAISGDALPAWVASILKKR